MAALQKLTGNFAATEVDGELLIIDLEGGELFSLTGTARSIWDALDGTRDTRGIADHLAHEYACDAETILPEVEQFIAELEEAALIAHVR